MLENNIWVEEILTDEELSIIKYADLSLADASLCRGFKYGISIAKALEIAPSAKKPSIEYYNGYRKITATLESTSYYLVDKIKERGYNAYSLASRKLESELKTQLSFRELAIQAGVGWIGKSATIVTEQYGSALRLSGVLTDMPLIVNSSVVSSFCGDCAECVKKCPGRALTGCLWDINTKKDALIDVNKCRETTFRRSQKFDFTEGNCGVCIAVCPKTKEYFKSR